MIRRDSWRLWQVLEEVSLYWNFFLSLAFQTGYFSLPTFPKETQQLHICTPVTQTNVAHSKVTELLNISSSVCNCSAYCLDNLKIV